jgi:hypothetical protein
MTAPFIVFETEQQRAASEQAYIDFLRREAKVRVIEFPNAADDLPEEDVEDDDE